MCATAPHALPRCPAGSASSDLCNRCWPDVCFSSFFSDAAIGETLVGLESRDYTAPAWKFPQAFRDALPVSLRNLLDWELPLRDPEEEVVPARL